MLAEWLAGLVGMRYVLPMGVFAPDPGFREEVPKAHEAAALGVLGVVRLGNGCGVGGWAILGYRVSQVKCRRLG